MNFRLFLTALFATFIAAANAQDNVPALDAEVAPSSLYTGFEQLLDDDQTLVLEDLIDLDPNIRRVALYHNGDRLHRQIPKQVHLMIENKLMHRMMDSERFEVIQCFRMPNYSSGDESR